MFVNTRLAEPYVEAEARMSEDELLLRREEYQAEIPDGVLILLAALGTQDDRLHAGSARSISGKTSGALKKPETSKKVTLRAVSGKNNPFSSNDNGS